MRVQFSQTNRFILGLIILGTFFFLLSCNGGKSQRSDDEDDMDEDDMIEESIQRVSVASDGTISDDNSFEPSINQDASLVAFQSFATTLVAPLVNNNGSTFSDIFLREIDVETTILTEDVNGEGAQ